MKKTIRTPFFNINLKSYIYGQEALDLAKVCDELAEAYDIDFFYDVQHVDLRLIAENTKHIIVTAQHLDGIMPGRGTGHMLPEAVKDAGARAVLLNHAEDPLESEELERAIERANEMELYTLVCCDTVEDARRIAALKPDIIICEPTSLIGTGQTSSDEYIRETNAVIRSISEHTLILQAASISTGEDVYRVMMKGADGSGATSGILNATDRREKIAEMLEALKRTT
ncbi:MAG: triose-phosphate isomerase [Lachnospiraceae bacterium]|nr:triose-phosphate isomerase [Lachnospiraceae bacterium]